MNGVFDAQHDYDASSYNLVIPYLSFELPPYKGKHFNYIIHTTELTVDYNLVSSLKLDNADELCLDKSDAIDGRCDWDLSSI